MERQRVTVQEAARILGVKEPAIRKRVKRGTLQSERVGNRVYVYLDADRSAGDSEERSTGTQRSSRDELLEELRRQNEYLREENRRKDHIIAGLVQRIPELEAPASPEARGSPESAPDRSDRGTTPEGAQTATQRPGEERRPWWRRVFGG